MCSVTPAAKAKDCSRWGIISVDTIISPGQTAELTISDLLPSEREVAYKERS